MEYTVFLFPHVTLLVKLFCHVVVRDKPATHQHSPANNKIHGGQAGWLVGRIVWCCWFEFDALLFTPTRLNEKNGPKKKVKVMMC